MQIIEYKSSNLDELMALVDQMREEQAFDPTALRGAIVADRERPGYYLSVVKVPSYEEAMKNSDHPATKTMAEKMPELVEGSPRFYNLEVVMRPRVHRPRVVGSRPRRLHRDSASAPPWFEPESQKRSRATRVA